MLTITDDGKLYFRDCRSIQRAILDSLLDGPKTLLEMTKWIRKRYIEFKHIQDKLIINALGELIKQKCIRSKY